MGYAPPSVFERPVLPTCVHTTSSPKHAHFAVSISEIKQQLLQRGVDFSHCVE